MPASPALMTPTSLPPSDDARDLAAYWFARLQSGEASADERARFEAWRAADPDHARQYAAIETLWQSAGTLDAGQQARLGRAYRTTAAMAGRRRWLAYGAGAGAAVAASLVAVTLWPLPEEYARSVATSRGERQEISLPDGSLLHLNTGSAARVRYDAGHRRVWLEDGEAFFTVTRDASRPFIVETGSGQVTVLGTQFNVRREGEAFSVAVSGGTVRVDRGPWWRRQSAVLTAGQGSRFAETASARPEVDVQAATAWRDGKIVFRETPLSQALAEMNRYLAEPVRPRFADPKLAALRVSGIFDTANPRALLAALPRILPLSVQSAADGTVDIVPR